MQLALHKLRSREEGRAFPSLLSRFSHSLLCWTGLQLQDWFASLASLPSYLFFFLCSRQERNERERKKVRERESGNSLNRSFGRRTLYWTCMKVVCMWLSHSRESKERRGDKKKTISSERLLAKKPHPLLLWCSVLLCCEERLDEVRRGGPQQTTLSTSTIFTIFLIDVIIIIFGLNSSYLIHFLST